MHRKTHEALLRSSFGEQRLARTKRARLNRVTLVPREPPPTWHQDDAIHWFDGHFLFQGRALTNGEHFRVGSTDVEFHEHQRRWPVDVERERELLRAGDDAWVVYADELISREDPLGFILRGAPDDVSMALEVRPLLAEGRLWVNADARGLWRELTFVSPYGQQLEWAGIFAAVLSHPIAWFLESVAFAREPEAQVVLDEFEVLDDFDVPDDASELLVTAIERFGGPFVKR